MVEIKSQNEENNTVKLPNNIRQVGTPGDKTKIYIEDYVMTYLNQITGEKNAGQKMALLLGEKVRKEDTDIYFISAAISVMPVEWKEDRFKLSTDEWAALYDKIDRYFKNRHILGWFLSRPGQAAAADGQIEKIHTDNFRDKGSLFYTVDPLDREDAFYLYENGHLFRQHGYYIYYERNEDMQNYMIEIRQENHVEEQGTPGFQNRLFEKKTDHRMKKEALVRKKGRSTKWVPQAAVLLLILAVIGIKRNLPGETVPVSQQIIENGQQAATTAADDTGHLDIVESIVQQAEQSVAEKNRQEETTRSDETANDSKGDSAKAYDSDTDNSTADNNSAGSSEKEQQQETGQNNIQQETAAETEVLGNAYKSYTVKEGDTLLKISREYYQDAAHVETIRQLNQIDDPDYIYPGMVLRLP